MLLAAAVIGSGIMAQRLTGDGAVALLGKHARDGCSVGRTDCRARAGQRSAFQSRGIDCLVPARAPLSASRCVVRGCAIVWMLSRCSAGARDVRVADDSDGNARQGWNRTIAVGDGRHGWSDHSGVVLHDLEGGCVARACMDRCRILVHGLDILCESRHHGSSCLVRHFRRDSARGCPGVHGGAGARSAGRDCRCPVAFFENNMSISSTVVDRADIRFHAAAPALQPYVGCFWVITAECGATVRVVPDGTTSIAIEQQPNRGFDGYLRGPLLRPVELRFSGSDHVDRRATSSRRRVQPQRGCRAFDGGSTHPSERLSAHSASSPRSTLCRTHPRTGSRRFRASSSTDSKERAFILSSRERSLRFTQSMAVSRSPMSPLVAEPANVISVA